MNFKELFEGVEPKMPGAPSGIQIMTPQQFVAKDGDMPDEKEVDEGVRDLGYDAQSLIMKLRRDVEERRLQPTREAVLSAARELAGDMDFAPELIVQQVLGKRITEENMYNSQFKSKEKAIQYAQEKVKTFRDPDDGIEIWSMPDGGFDVVATMNSNGRNHCIQNGGKKLGTIGQRHSGVNEDIDRIRKLSGLDEATKLSAPNREFGSDEFQDYMKRIVGKPDIDKKTGEVKKQKDRVTKKGEVVPGKDKYISGKTKSDKYKLPYIHRNSAVQYVGPDGQSYSEEKIIAALKQRPKSLLKQNEKMRHSNGEQEQFFNIGFAALTGIAVDEQTGKLIIVNTCPGAGSCKVDCFVIHQGGKIQFEGPWLNDGRILTYLLNDPDGFFNQLSNEIFKEEQLGKKGGYNVTIRWHDSGDFFSPEYLEMALKMASKHPDNKFYAYTKMAGAALAKKPDNFIINWSEGAHTSQEKQVKAQDPTLSSTKNSRIVPEEMFQDLLARDEKKNLVKGSQGQWQLQPGKLPELKERLAKQYGLSANSILSYDEYMAKRNKIPAGMKYNVIVMGGEGDVSANDPGVLSTLLLKH